LRPAIVLALISLVLCGLFVPLLITGIAQVALPYQANGELVQINGHYVGSSLIAQQFTKPIFFYPRNASDSASGVDPDITVQDAYSQVSRISNATDIPPSLLRPIIDQNVYPLSGTLAEPYVNVLTLNLALIKAFPVTYNSFS
jgi:K+-transporting ATPase ATPase C chain